MLGIVNKNIATQFINVVIPTGYIEDRKLVNYFLNTTLKLKEWFTTVYAEYVTYTYTH